MLKVIKPLFWTAQALGVSIFKTEGRKLGISKKGIFYFTMLYTVNTTFLIYATYVAFYNERVNLRQRIFSIARTLFGYACLTANNIVTITLRHHLESALNCLNVYDTSSRFNSNDSKRGILDYSRSAVIFMIAYWCVIGYIILQNESEKHPYCLALAYAQFYSIVSVQILMFCGLVLMIHQRFNHLSRIISRNDSMKVLINEIHPTPYNIELQDVWWLHSKLIDAAEKINYVFSIQISLWIFSLSLNCLSRIYTLTNDHNDLFVITRDSLCCIGCFIDVFIIIIVCHLTSRKANRIAKKVFSPTSIVLTRSSISKNDDAAITYFRITKLYFEGAYGLIHVHLPLLISIIGAVTTYLVILHKN